MARPAAGKNAWRAETPSNAGKPCRSIRPFCRPPAEALTILAILATFMEPATSLGNDANISGIHKKGVRTLFLDRPRLRRLMGHGKLDPAGRHRFVLDGPVHR